MKKFFIILSLLMVGMISGSAQTLTAKAYMTMDGQQLKLRERADYAVADPQATASDYNNVGVAAYYAGVRYVQFGTNDLEGLPLSVIVPAHTNSITITFNVVDGTQLYLVDATDDSRTPINAGENVNYTVDDEEDAYAINNRFSISKSATPPADTQELPSSLGTFVSNKKVASVTGAVLYEIIATDGVSNITFQEVNMTNGLAAGTPVLYQKTDATAFVTFTDDEPINGVYAYANGFVGLLPGNNSKDEYMGDGDLWALVSAEGNLKFVDTWCTLTPGHAYIDMNEIIPANFAPGRRRLMIGRNGIVTDVENAAAEVKGARKSIENGKIVILKNGQKYNVAGQMMK